MENEEKFEPGEYAGCQANKHTMLGQRVQGSEEKTRCETTMFLNEIIVPRTNFNFGARCSRAQIEEKHVRTAYRFGSRIHAFKYIYPVPSPNTIRNNFHMIIE